MRDRDDIEAIRAALADPHDVARRLNLDKGAQRQGAGVLVCCPSHGDRTPSCSLTRGPDGTLRVRCFGCDLAGDVFDLLAAVERLDRDRDFREVLERAAALAGVTLSTDDPTAPRRERAPLPPPPPPPPPRVYPDPRELRGLLDVCGPCARDEEVSAWLRSRALDVSAVDRFGLAFALPAGAPVPRWAMYRGAREAAATWGELGYRAIVPMRDAAGRVCSVRARRVIAGAEGPKALPPTGCKADGVVMADPLGSMMLALGAWPAGAERRVVLCEGEPDWLTWAARGSEGTARKLAVLGIGGNGAWTAGIADRIPDGSEVIIRTDPDDAGDRYAEQITRSLRGRCVVMESDAQGRAARRAQRTGLQG